MIASAFLALALTAAPLQTTLTLQTNVKTVTYGHEQKAYVTGDVIPKAPKMVTGTVTIYWMVNESPTFGDWHKLGIAKVENPYPTCAVGVYKYTLKPRQLKPGSYILDATYSGAPGIAAADTNEQQITPTLVVKR